MTRIWARVRDGLLQHGKLAMVTVVATKGSAPREAGARLIVNPDGTFTGTVGGGTLEWRAIALAQSALSAASPRRAEIRKFALGPELGQCCGGQAELVVEVIRNGDRGMVDDLAVREEAGAFTTRATVSFEKGVSREVVEGMSVPAGSAVWRDGSLIEGFGDRRRPVLLFGAGHVGRAIVLALAPLPFTVTWIDQRPDAFPSHLPGNTIAKRLEDPISALEDAAAETFVLVMTHSHPLDLALVVAALGLNRFPYTGLIGSMSKRVRFEHRLRAGGISSARIDDLVCPIGVGGIKSKEPAAIAAATVAELLTRDEALRAQESPPEDVTLRPRLSRSG